MVEQAAAEQPSPTEAAPGDRWGDPLGEDWQAELKDRLPVRAPAPSSTLSGPAASFGTASTLAPWPAPPLPAPSGLQRPLRHTLAHLQAAALRTALTRTRTLVGP